MHIYGYDTKPLRTVTPISCGSTGDTGTTSRIVSSMNYNLDVYYQINQTHTDTPRVVTVLCQLGYLEASTGNTIVETLFIGNRQFYPTLDIEYGENFAGSVDIPSDLAALAISNMPDPLFTPAVQLVFYKEDGVCFWQNLGAGFECRDDSVNNPPAGSVSLANSIIPCGFPINTINPNTGPVVGGQSVTISLASFLPLPSDYSVTVTFGGNPATNIVIVPNSPSFTCDTPPNDNPGTVNVVVQCSNGTGFPYNTSYTYV